MSDLWSEASRDLEAENSLRRITAARVEATPIWPFLAAAESVSDYKMRKELVSDRLDNAVIAAVGDLDTDLRATLERSFDADYNIVLRTAAKESAKTAGDRATCSCGYSTTSDAAWQDHIFKNQNSNEFKSGHERVSSKTASKYCETHKVWVGSGNAGNHDSACKMRKKESAVKTADTGDLDSSTGEMNYTSPGGTKYVVLSGDDADGTSDLSGNSGSADNPLVRVKTGDSSNAIVLRSEVDQVKQGAKTAMSYYKCLDCGTGNKTTDAASNEYCGKCGSSRMDAVDKWDVPGAIPAKAHASKAAAGVDNGKGWKDLGDDLKSKNHDGGTAYEEMPEWRKKELEDAAVYSAKKTAVTMTRQHFQAIADAIKSYPGEKSGLAEHFATQLSGSNAQFDRDRFIKACGSKKTADGDAPVRRAIIRGGNADQVANYLPRNYHVVQETPDGVIIEGTDNAGWTLDDYVLPRLGSGLMGGEEITATGSRLPFDRTSSAGGGEKTAVTIPYAAADTLGESLTIDVASDWESTVQAAAQYATYGPDYSRGVAEALYWLSQSPDDEYRYADLQRSLESASGKTAASSSPDIEVTPENHGSSYGWKCNDCGKTGRVAWDQPIKHSHDKTSAFKAKVQASLKKRATATTCPNCGYHLNQREVENADYAGSDAECPNCEKLLGKQSSKTAATFSRNDVVTVSGEGDTQYKVWTVSGDSAELKDVKNNRTWNYPVSDLTMVTPYDPSVHSANKKTANTDYRGNYNITVTRVDENGEVQGAASETPPWHWEVKNLDLPSDQTLIADGYKPTQAEAYSAADAAATAFARSGEGRELAPLGQLAVADIVAQALKNVMAEANPYMPGPANPYSPTTPDTGVGNGANDFMPEPTTAPDSAVPDQTTPMTTRPRQMPSSDQPDSAAQPTMSQPNQTPTVTSAQSPPKGMEG